MTVQSIQDMVQKDLRRAMGLLERSEEGLAEVMHDRVKCAMLPGQLFQPGRLMGVSNFIQSGLSDIQHQCVKGMWDQACWLIL